MEKQNQNHNLQSTVIKIIESGLISVAASFPVAASLATGWAEYKNHRQAERINDLLNLFGQRLQEMAGQVDKDYLKTDEAKNLVEQTINKGKDELRAEKRKMLVEFLANSTTTKNAADQEKEMVLDTIDRVSPSQIQILKNITQGIVFQWGRANVRLSSDYNPDAKDKPTFGYILESRLVAQNQTSNTKDNIEASLDYMVSIGVIEVASARGWTNVGGKTGIKGFRPTKLGLKILEYLGIMVDNMLELPRKET
jgi:hypothetical protein